MDAKQKNKCNRRLRLTADYPVQLTTHFVLLGVVVTKRPDPEPKSSRANLDCWQLLSLQYFITSPLCSSPS